MQKQIEKAMECARQWRVTANVKRCAVVVCNEDEVNPVRFSWKWGEDEFTDRRPVYVPWRRDLERLLSGYTRSKSNRKG